MLSHRHSMVMEQVRLLGCLLWQEEGLPLNDTRPDLALDDKEATIRSRISHHSLLKDAAKNHAWMTVVPNHRYITNSPPSHLRQVETLNRKSLNSTSPSTDKTMKAT